MRTVEELKADRADSTEPVKTPGMVEQRAEKAPIAPKDQKKPENLYISIDNTEEEVLNFEQEGKSLYFESDLGRFLVLSEDAVVSLNRFNQARYFASFYLHQKAQEMAKTPATPGLEIDGRYARASARLEVYGKNPGKHYAWIDPPNVRVREYEGYQVTNDPDISTFGSQVGGSHEVKVAGQAPELILMETSKENFQKVRQIGEQKSRQRVAVEEDKTRAEIEADGGVAFTSKDLKEQRNKGPRRPMPQFSPPNIVRD